MLDAIFQVPERNVRLSSASPDHFPPYFMASRRARRRAGLASSGRSSLVCVIFAVSTVMRLWCGASVCAIGGAALRRWPLFKATAGYNGSGQSERRTLISYSHYFTDNFWCE